MAVPKGFELALPVLASPCGGISVGCGDSGGGSIVGVGVRVGALVGVGKTVAVGGAGVCVGVTCASRMISRSPG